MGRGGVVVVRTVVAITMHAMVVNVREGRWSGSGHHECCCHLQHGIGHVRSVISLLLLSSLFWSRNIVVLMIINTAGSILLVEAVIGVVALKEVEEVGVFVLVVVGCSGWLLSLLLSLWWWSMMLAVMVVVGIVALEVLVVVGVLC